jgi:hypothetical protein
MMRTCAVVVVAAALAGCRGSQQATNPFLRTTVPPPGTGEAAVVVPGEPYYPGAAPAAPPPGAAATAPVAPVPAQPQPVIPPPRDLRRAVPGGDYIYHQSSVEGAKSVDPDDVDSNDGPADRPAGELAVDGEAAGAIRLGGPSDAVEQALAMSQEGGPADSESFEKYNGRLPEETTAAGNLGQQTKRPVARTEVRYRPPWRRSA